MNQEILRLRKDGARAKQIADQLGIPLARVWRVIARSWRESAEDYARAYREGRATVQAAGERIAKAERAAIRLEQEVVELKDALGAARREQFLPDSRWQARASAIAKESSPSRRLMLLDLPLDQELPPAAVIDLRTKREETGS